MILALEYAEYFGTFLTEDENELLVKLRFDYRKCDQQSYVEEVRKNCYHRARHGYEKKKVDQLIHKLNEAKKKALSGSWGRK